MNTTTNRVALTVMCPVRYCSSDVGHGCKTLSGNPAPAHPARTVKAMEAAKTCPRCKACARCSEHDVQAAAR